MYLKVGRGEKLGSFWNISMLRKLHRHHLNKYNRYTVCINSSWRSPDAYTEILKKSNRSPSWCSNSNHILSYVPLTVKYILHFKGETERGSIVIRLSLTLVLHKHLNEHLRRTYMMLRASSSVSVNEGMGWGSFIHYTRVKTKSRIHSALTKRCSTGRFNSTGATFNGFITKV